VAALQFQQSQRHPDLVVKVAAVFNVGQRVSSTAATISLVVVLPWSR
jgi:hypothetical protein